MRSVQQSLIYLLPLAGFVLVVVLWNLRPNAEIDIPLHDTYLVLGDEVQNAFWVAVWGTCLGANILFRRRTRRRMHIVGIAGMGALLMAMVIHIYLVLDAGFPRRYYAPAEDAPGFFAKFFDTAGLMSGMTLLLVGGLIAYVLGFVLSRKPAQ